MNGTEAIGLQWAWLAPAACVGAFTALALFGRYLPWKGPYIAIGAIGFGFVLFWFLLNDLLHGAAREFSATWFEAGGGVFDLGMTIDPVAMVMMGVITFVSLLVQIYSLGYMRGESRLAWYFAVHSLFVASMLGIVLSNNLLVLYVGWELVGICSYLLIGFWYERRSAAEAAKKAFITTRIGDVGLLVGILLLYNKLGTFHIPTILEAVEAGELSSGIMTLSAILIFLGAMGKSAQFPLHVWLPDAMEGPTPVSALIHAATMVVAGVYLVARMLPLFEAAPAVSELVIAIGLITAVMGATMALSSTDLKRVLAYSTVSQIGFMMLALGHGALAAAMFHLATHALFKALLFLGAGNVLHAVGEHSDVDIRRLGGLRSRMPVTSVVFVIAALALSGIPPLSGFWSKDEILQGIWKDGNPVTLVITIGAFFLSALYMTRLCWLVFFGKLKPENETVHEAPFVMTGPIALLGILTLVFGFTAPDWLDNVLGLPGEATGFGSFVLDKADSFHEHVVLAAVSSVVALVGIVFGLAIYRQGMSLPGSVERGLAPVRKLAANKYYLDDAYQWTIDRVVLGIGGATAWFDRHVVNDAGVDGTGLFTAKMSRILRRHQTGQVSNYVLGITVGTLIFVVAITLAA